MESEQKQNENIGGEEQNGMRAKQKQNTNMEINKGWNQNLMDDGTSQSKTTRMEE